MIKVKLNVQTMYKGELLRAGKVYEINRETAERWIMSNLATKIEEYNDKDKKWPRKLIITYKTWQPKFQFINKNSVSDLYVTNTIINP